jgi:hypothetical protein
MNNKMVDFFYLLMENRISPEFIENIFEQFDKRDKNIAHRDTELAKFANVFSRRLFANRVNDNDFLKLIEFEHCPVTKSCVDLIMRRHSCNFSYRGEVYNESNFIEVVKGFLDTKEDNNCFGIKGVKNNFGFYSLFNIKSNNLFESKHHNNDGKPILFIDLKKKNFSEFHLPYIVKNGHTFIQKVIEKEFCSIKEFWDYLDTFAEFK